MVCIRKDWEYHLQFFQRGKFSWQPLEHEIKFVGMISYKRVEKNWIRLNNTIKRLSGCDIITTYSVYTCHIFLVLDVFADRRYVFSI